MSRSAAVVAAAVFTVLLLAVVVFAAAGAHADGDAMPRQRIVDAPNTVGAVVASAASTAPLPDDVGVYVERGPGR